MNLRTILYFFLFATFLSLGSCDKDDPDDPDIEDPDDPDVDDGELVTLNVLHFKSAKSARLIVINTKSGWTVSSDADWLQFTQSSGDGKTGILIGATKNEGMIRKTSVFVVSGTRKDTLAVTQEAAPRLQFAVGKEKLELVLVEAATFTRKEYSSYYSHEVKLDSFYISAFEITNALWKEVTGGLPYDTMENAIRTSSLITAPELSVSYVTFTDVTQGFLPALKEKLKLDFRLPTEAEWEFAARGGKLSKGYLYAGSNMLDDVAWRYSNSNSRKHPPGQLKANELGLYDMSGNLSEWCGDWYDVYPSGLVVNPTGPSSGTQKVTRGGNYKSEAMFGETAACRVDFRYYVQPGISENSIGLRVVMPVPQK